jgi:hypothetical protein
MSETQTNSTTSRTTSDPPARFPDVRRLVAQHPAEALVAVVAVLAFADYVSRCARVITRDDPAELQVVALAGGIPHGTSYPLYVWLTRAFAHVPVGTLSFRFNLFSSVCAAITLVALAATVAHIDQKERRGWIAGAFAAVVFAPSYSFTQVASFTGMYTLHTAMTFVGVGLFVRWMEQKRPADLERSLVVLAAMLANHVMTVAIYPAIFVALVGTLIADRARFSVHRGPLLRGVLGGIAAVLVLDLFFFYLLWKNHVTFDHWASIVRAPKFFDVRPDQAKSFAYAFYYEITCRQFRFDVVGATWDQRMQQLGFVLPRLASELSPLVVALAFVGLGRLARRAPLRFALVATFVFAHLWLASGYTATVKTQTPMKRRWPKLRSRRAEKILVRPRGLDVVLDALELEALRVGVVDGEARAVVVVAGLPHAADRHDVLAVGLEVEVGGGLLDRPPRRVSANTLQRCEWPMSVRCPSSS